MEEKFSEQRFLILKGFIDAKNERGHEFFGSFLALLTRRETRYLDVMFSKSKNQRGKHWEELLAIHGNKNDREELDPVIEQCEKELHRYFDVSKILNNVAKNHNTKQAEQAVSRFCMDRLDFKTVSFIEFQDATVEDLERFDREIERTKQDQDGREEAKQEETVDSTENDAMPVDEPDKEICIRCEPILDPLLGVATSELPIGSYVACRLAQDSVFYKLLAKNFPNTNDVVKGKVSGILMNDLGTATVSLWLCDGVCGVMQLSGKVRLKMVRGPEETSRKDSPRHLPQIPNISSRFVFVAAGVFLSLVAIVVLFYVLYD